MRRMIIGLCAWYLLANATTVFADIIYSDGSFSDADWSASIFRDTTFDHSGSFSTSQVLTGGIPGSYRQTVMTWDYNGSGISQQLFVAHLMNGATYNPSTQGAITSLDYSESLIVTQEVGGTPGMFVSPLLVQAGNYFTTSTGLSSVSNVWANASLTGLSDSSFLQVLPGSNGVGGALLDLSSTGSVIQFGYFTASGAGSGGASTITITSGIDNWSYDLKTSPTATPTPSTLVMSSILFGMFGVVWSYKRLKQAAIAE